MQEVAKLKPTVKNVRNVLFRCLLNVASTQQKLLNAKMGQLKPFRIEFKQLK